MPLLFFLFVSEKTTFENQSEYCGSIKLHIAAETNNISLICSKRDSVILLKSILNVFKRQITCSTNMRTFAIELQARIKYLRKTLVFM